MVKTISWPYILHKIKDNKGLSECQEILPRFYDGCRRLSMIVWCKVDTLEVLTEYVILAKATVEMLKSLTSV